MAVVEEKVEGVVDHQEVERILAQMRPLYKELVAVQSANEALSRKLRNFEGEITTLLNWQEGYEKRSKAADIRLAQAEQAAKTRLSTMEHGHKTLIDDLSRKQLESDKAKADAEAMTRKLIEERGQLAALKDHYERQIAAVNATTPKKSK